MPHSLTERQREYLEYIRGFIQENERSPRLEEIAENFSVKLPTAHKMLDALQLKGYIYFQRSSEWGFFIRLIERAGMSEVVIQIPVFGRVDGYGELYDYPQDLGSIPDIFFGIASESAFALVAMDAIPQASIRVGDLIIFDLNKRPQANDICIAPMGDRFFLIKIASRTIDRRMMTFETAIGFPIPQEMIDPDHRKYLNWYPLAYDDDTDEYFTNLAKEQDWSIAPLDPKLIMATALRQWRALAA